MLGALEIRGRWMARKSSGCNAIARSVIIPEMTGRVDIMNKTRGVVIAWVGVAFFMAVSESRAALSSLGGEFPLLGDISGHQQNPNVALGQSGGVVVWQNMPANGRSERVMVQRLGSDLTGVGVPIRLSQSNSEGNELNPRVSMLPDGGAVAVWESGPRANKDIFVRILNAAGSFVTGALPANTHMAGNQQDADVTVLTDGNVVVVWSSEGQDGDGSGIYGQLFTAGGARIGGEFQVNGTPSMNQSDPAVATMGDGKFALAWVSEAINGRTEAGAPNLRGNIMGRVFDANGRAAGNEYQLNDNDTLASTPTLATGKDGGFVAAWTQRDEKITKNMNDIYIRSFNSGGVPSGKSEKHNTHLSGQQLRPELVQLVGNALVTWTSYGQDASGAGIQGRLSSGGTEFQVNSQGQLHQSSPTEATDSASKFLVVWVNTIQPSHSILSAQRYVTSDSALAGVVDVTAGEVQVVSAESSSRLTGAGGVKSKSAKVEVSTSAIQASPQVSSSAPSVSAPVAPAPVTANSVPVQPPTPTAVSSSSLASARMEAPSAASRQVPQRRTFSQQRSATAGRSTMQRMAQNRSLGRSSPSYGGRASQMARAPQSRSGQLGSRSRSLPSRDMSPGVNYSSRYSSRGSQVQRTSLASARANPAPRAALNKLNRYGRAGSTGRQSVTAGRRSSPVQGRSSNPAQSRTVQASLKRGEAGGYNLSWQSQAGKRYVVQGSNDLKSWNNVGSARSGRGGSDSVRVGGSNTSNAPRYYRVQQAN